MNKLRFKRILSGFAAITIALGTTACGNADKSEDKMAKKDGAAANRAAIEKSDGEFKGEAAEAAPEADGAAEDFAAADKDAADADRMEACSPEDIMTDDYFAEDAATAEGGDITEINSVDGDFDGEPTEKEIPVAGQLTAGEWNDNDNWGFFSNLVSSGAISFPSFGIDPTNRIAVTVKHSDGTELANAKVILRDSDGNALWSARSDKNGRAYLFCEVGKAATVDVSTSDYLQSYPLKEKSSGGEQGGSAGSTELEVTFDGDKLSCADMQIMFIVDSTGSMGDEMLFLQSEFSAIANEVGTENTEYSVNFYRDEGDEYVTKCSGFTRDIDALQTTLNSETAEGGGDYPEAVAEILTETMFSSEWREDAVKVAFMIFDAPPHAERGEELLAAAKAAAENGVRIVPVVSSNSERDTELFARALAITSGGSYVFLTDDSGIGDSHLEPIIGEYEVEKLYDIIIRIIDRYRQ